MHTVNNLKAGLKIKRHFALLTFLFAVFMLQSCGESKDPAIAEIDAFIKTQNLDLSNSLWKTGLKVPPKLKFPEDSVYFWDLETNVGNISIQLMPDVAPMHVSSTIYLTELGFYDGLLFHRVIKNFMAQGGDPLGNGRGGPGYLYDGEFDKSVRHTKAGLLSMANRGPKTDGSQFFITFKATPHLDNKHTIFGEVKQGMDTLKKLEELGSYNGKTQQELKIKKALIRVEKT